MSPCSSFTGKCECGKVEVLLEPREGQELKAGWCHCFSCRKHYMAPATLEVMLRDCAPGQGFRLEGATREDVRTQATHTTVRLRCAECLSPMATRWKMNDATEWSWAFPSTLFNLVEGERLPEGFPQPKAHSWYQNRIVDMKDGLPKWQTWEGYSEQVQE